MSVSSIPRITFHNLEFSPRNFKEYGFYHSQIKHIVNRLNVIDSLTVCDPPLTYRLHRIRHMIDNPRVIYADINVNNAEVISTSKLREKFEPKPVDIEISKGEVELLDSKRQPVIFVCPVCIPTEDNKKVTITSKSGDQQDLEKVILYKRKNILSEDQGYDSLPSSLRSNTDYIQNGIKTQVSLALGCISDDVATSVLFLVNSNKDGKDDERKKEIVEALKEYFPEIYGNRSDDPHVCFLDNHLRDNLDKMFLKVLTKQLKLLNTSMELIQKDLVTQATSICNISGPHLQYISHTICKLIAPDEQHLMKIAETVKHVETLHSTKLLASYSYCLRNQILDQVFQDTFTYIDRELNPVDKTLVSRAIMKYRQGSLQIIPDWGMIVVFVFIPFLLFLLVTNNHFGLLQAIGLEVLIIHIIVLTEASFLNAKRVVSSVHRYLQSSKKTITENVLCEHNKSLNILNCRKEHVFKIQIQICKTLEDLNPKRRQADHILRRNPQIEEYLLNSQYVVGFGYMQGKLYVHVVEDATVEDIREGLMNTYKLECNQYLICPFHSSKDSKPGLDIKSVSQTSLQMINSKMGVFFRNCKGDIHFVIRSSMISRGNEIDIYLQNRRVIKGHLKARTEDQSFSHTNFYPLSIFYIKDFDSTKIETAEIHNCDNGELTTDMNIASRLVDMSNKNDMMSPLQFLVISEKYVYKGLGSNSTTYMDLFLMTPLSFEQNWICWKSELVYLNTTDNDGSPKPAGLAIGKLTSFPFPCNDKVDLGKEDLLAVIPFPQLLRFLHIVCCDEEIVDEHH